jgi:hypothetical protein
VSGIHRGGCLCGAIRFEARAPAARPHTCSCDQCRRHTGAFTACWVEFAREAVRWVGPGGAPSTWRSSDWSSRAFCAACGSSIGAIDDESTVALLVAVFDDCDAPELRPSSGSFQDMKPHWWHVTVDP